MTSTLIPQEKIESKIFLLRGVKVMLDRDLAELYKVRARALRQQVKRNKERFPGDFMFQLSEKEVEILVSQNVTPSKQSLGGYLPYAFTEQGVAMLSTVLNSKRAIQVNIQIMRTFTRLKKIIETNKKLAFKFKELESKVKQHDGEIKSIFEAIRQLIITSEKPKRKIGFV